MLLPRKEGDVVVYIKEQVMEEFLQNVEKFE